MLSGYGLTITISRYFGATGSGFISYYFSLYTFIAIFFTAGMDTSLNYFLSSEKMSKQKITSVALIMLIVLHIIIILFCASQFFFSSINFITGYILFFFLFTTGISVTNIFSALLNAEGRLFKYNIILSAGPVVLSSLLIYQYCKGVVVKEAIFLGWMGVSVYISAIIIAVMFFATKKPFEFMRISKEEKKKIFRFAFIFLITALLNLLLTRLDYWFVKNSCTGAELGNYIQSSRFGQIALLLPGMISFALFPDAVKNAKNNSTQNIRLLAKIYFYGAILFCLAFTLSGNMVFPFLFGKSFTNMSVLFTLSAPGIIFLSLSYPYAIYFPAIQHIKILLLSLFCTVVFLMLVYFMIAPFQNVYLFAVASSGGYIIYCLILLIAFCKSNRIKLVSLFVINNDEIQRIKKSYLNIKNTLIT